MREGLQRWRCFHGEPIRREFCVPNFDLLEILDAPEIAVHTNAAQIHCRDSGGLAAGLAVPCVKAAENKVGVAVLKLADFNRAGVVYQKNENVPVTGVKRCCVLRHWHKRVIDRPAIRCAGHHAGDFPAAALARKAVDCLQHLIIENAAIIRAGGGPELAALGAVPVGLHKVAAAVIAQAPLHSVGGNRCRKVSQISGRRSGQIGKLIE